MKEQIEKSTLDSLIALGENPQRDGLIETPKRVARAYEEWFSGYKVKNPEKILEKEFKLEYDTSGMVTIEGIEFHSFCEHHMAPFFGQVYIGYIPKGNVVKGLSKFVRLVDVFARRLQTQERMTEQIADTIQKALQPLGVIVVCKAKHLCVCSRGAKKNINMGYSALRGVYHKEQVARMEFFETLKVKGAD